MATAARMRRNVPGRGGNKGEGYRGEDRRGKGRRGNFGRGFGEGPGDKFE